MYSLDSVFIKSFNSLSEAGIYIKKEKSLQSKIKSIVSHICDVCKGNREKAFGYIWKYSD